MSNIWQIAAGDGGRDYSEVFLKYGVMLIGNGDAGEYFSHKEQYKSCGWGKYNIIFAEQIAEGDIVVLANSKRCEILAVGTVGNYSYEPFFDDVEGWDLQHCRSVKWGKPHNQTPISRLCRRGTINRIDNKDIKEKINNILYSGESFQSNSFPSEKVKTITNEELTNKLVDSKILYSKEDTGNFVQTLDKIQRLAKFYSKDYDWKNVLEHETRTFLIIPLLLALGWTEEKIKIEWNITGRKKIDTALFKKNYCLENKNNNCVIILEAKRFGDGLSYTFNQAKEYADKLLQCNTIITSDGCCYKLYKRIGNRWNPDKKIDAYLNILKPKDKYPYESNVGGALDIFKSLACK
jgi:hypothetical protein